jgi:hypothetical protein
VNWLKKYSTNNLLLFNKGRLITVIFSLVIASIAFVFYLDVRYPKYEYKFKNQFESYKGFKLYYDLDYDDNFELLQVYKTSNTEKSCNIMIFNGDISSPIIQSQTNINRPLVYSSPPIIGDIDNNKLAEICLFTHIDSTLFIDIYEYTNTGDLTKKIDSKLVCKIPYLPNDEIDFVIHHTKPVDINNDGIQEFVFLVKGRFTPYPRRIFAYDIVKDTFISSPNTQISLNGLQYKKSKNSLVFLPKYITSHQNCKDTSCYYNDHYTWILGFDSDLKHLFPPIKKDHPLGNQINHMAVERNDSLLLVVKYDLPNKNADSTIIQTYTLDGLLLNEHIIFHSSFNEILQTNIEQAPYILTGENKLILLDKHFNEIEIIEPFDQDNHIRNMFSVSNKMNDEIFVVFSDQRGFCLYNENFKLLLQGELNMSYIMDVKYLDYRNNKHYLFFSNSEMTTLFIYWKSDKRYLAWLFGSLIFLLFFVGINQIVKYQINTIEKRNQQEKSLIESQLKIANKQMSPHFQLNVLNSISYLFENDKEKAQYYMSKYSRLVTESMMNVDKITTPLSNEIKFIKNYLALEQLRLDNRFDYTIDVDEKINQNILIPRMLIFTFCENAVKHGLFHLTERKGKLDLSIKLINNHIHISIIDNGIGKEASRKFNTHGTGMGIKTVEKIIHHYNQINKNKIKYALTENQPHGLKVIIDISV